MGYAWSTFAGDSFGTAIFLGTGAVLFAMSVPWSSSFHRAFAVAAFVALAAVVLFGVAVALAGILVCLLGASVVITHRIAGPAFAQAVDALDLAMMNLDLASAQAACQDLWAQLS